MLFCWRERREKRKRLTGLGLRKRYKQVILTQLKRRQNQHIEKDRLQTVNYHKLFKPAKLKQTACLKPEANNNSLKPQKLASKLLTCIKLASYKPVTISKLLACIKLASSKPVTNKSLKTTKLVKLLQKQA